ncbi:MAG TPA: hypothetical protein VGU44_03130 [Gammaproteobacteria bacterium]|nr:hypothetical protein [Gammaproteobacteria bacterium]
MSVVGPLNRSEQPFDRAAEFPNYFEMMLNSVPAQEREKFCEKIQTLIEGNISTIIKRVKIWYLNDKDELSNDDYFNKLVETMRRPLEASILKKSYKLHVYLTGGVVRTLLAFVYKQLYINIQKILENELYSPKTSQDKDKVFREILTELEQAFTTDREVLDKAKQQTATAMLTTILNQESFLKDLTKTPEFWLGSLKTQQSRVLGLYVLGVGSDMDIGYELIPIEDQKVTQEQADALTEVRKNIETAGKTLLNSAGMRLKLPAIKSDIEKSLCPPADLKPYKPQIEKAMLESGGCSLDWLAFELSPPEGRQKLIEPPSELCEKIDLIGSIITRLIYGYYRYVIKRTKRVIHRIATYKLYVLTDLCLNLDS